MTAKFLDIYTPLDRTHTVTYHTKYDDYRPTEKKIPTLRFRVLEEAREAVTKLRTLRPLLSPQDAETLAILMDHDLMDHLDRSMREASAGKTEPLAHMLA